MKKLTKKSLAIVMAAAMAGLTGCGSGSGSTAATTAANSQEASSQIPSDAHILNIWCWNTEFQSRFNDFYPEVESVASDKSFTKLKNGTYVKWTINENVNNNYQNKLDEALMAQEKASENDKIDMFLVEADYALKYVDSDFTLDVQKDIGLTADDFADQYQYTKDIVSVNGVQKGTTWQATPGLFAYRRSIAKDVLGTDDPDKVQEALSDWDKFDEVAAKAHDKGYKMLSGFDDSYRTFSNNVSAPWVTGTTVTVDKNIMRWVEQTKNYTDKEYNNKTSLWSDGWAADQSADGKVFGFFYSTWGINFTLLGNAGEKGFGDWAVCYGPAPYYWGGTWLCAAAGTDDADNIKDIMKQLTCNSEIMESMTRNQEIQDYTNTVSGMEKIAADTSFGSDFLGGQNHVSLFSNTAKEIDMSNISSYDQGCNELIQRAMKDYFNGNVDLDTAKANFETSIKESYPEITEVVWPE